MELLRMSGFLERVDEELNEAAENEGEADRLPENCHYRDEGCELAEACLECPFPKCVYDEPEGRRSWQRKQRTAEITRLHHTEKLNVKDIARRLGISTRTVQRALKPEANVNQHLNINAAKARDKQARLFRLERSQLRMMAMEGYAYNEFCF